MPSFANTLAILALALTGVNAYKFHYYASQQCTSQKLLEDVLGPDQGCQTLDSARANAGSLIIESTGPVDDPFMVVLFDSIDCNPDTIVGHGDENGGCLKPDEGRAFHSYQVWDLWE
ncbi:hypothetical protein FZEAL_1087 [Fusarium zealandicum]|uniref:Uncharacterized protein n=1 Tax=Fusarium zealandicum TaxID=1053134 RepID=A0A8H4UU81_9HYPO|nr:hypothetical protein FZEAL_1087 [Fusarium zealandicum]